MAEPVRISGMGCISAAGANLAENLHSLAVGQRKLCLPETFSPERLFPVHCCDVPDSAGSALMPNGPALLGSSRTARLALVAAVEALDDAGLNAQSLKTLRVGICMGTSVGASLDFLDYYRAHREKKPAPLESVRTYLQSNPALFLARALGTHGPVQTIVNACSSGADAIGLASQWLREGRCDIAVAGGADGLSYLTYMGFASLNLLSTQACRPFDKHRAGLNLGEGAGVMVLENMRQPVATQKAWGFMCGYGTATDAHHLTSPHLQARGLHRAWSDCLAQAAIGRSAIAFVNTHGTATPTNDAIEGAFLRDTLPNTPFIATKGCTGHTLGAAGAIEAVFTVAHLSAGLLPPSVGFSLEDPDIGVKPVHTPTPIKGDYALSQSLAFGGNNSVLLLGKGERHVD